MINTDALRGSASAYTSFVTLSANVATPMATASTSVAIRDSSAVLTITSRSDAAPTPVNNPLKSIDESTVAPKPSHIKTSPTGFTTVARMV